jgi:hypothetical protein
VLEAVIRFVWGYDFFVSYQWASGGTYAAQLAVMLGGKGFDCFLDRHDFAAGDNWSAEAQRAVRRTQRLVVIATPGALAESAAVAGEIRHFVQRSKHVVLIVFERRFAVEERARLTALTLLPEQQLDIVEPRPVTEGVPSASVIDELVRTHKVLRRRRLRQLTIGAAVAVLTVMLIVTTFQYWAALEAKASEHRRRLEVTATGLVVEANLLRTTRGPALDESLQKAVDGFRAARSAGADTASARAAIEATLALLPERIGAPVRPVAGRVTLATFADRALVRSADADEPMPAGDDEAEDAPDSWATLRFDGAWKPVAAADPSHGERIPINDAPRWIATRRNGTVAIWDATTGAERAVLPFDGDPYGDGETLAAISATGNAAVSRRSDGFALWDLTAQPPASTRVDLEVTSAIAISPRGNWIAGAFEARDAREIRVSRTRDAGRRGTGFAEFTRRHGNLLQLAFRARDEDDFTDDPPVALAAVWSDNQAAQISPAAEADAPAHHGAVWLLGEPAHDELAKSERAPLHSLAPIVRREELRLVLGPGAVVAILDSDGPLHVQYLRSGLPYILGGDAGPAFEAAFSPTGDLLITVHVDGTARLWSLRCAIRECEDSAAPPELLRFTAPAGIRHAAFLTEPGDDADRAPVTAIVTLDRDGQLQAWSPERTIRTVDELTADRSLDPP